MPINGSGTGADKNSAGRTTFRPPWVKDGPQPIPMPSAPWTKRNTTEPKENGQQDAKLQSREVKVPVLTSTKVLNLKPVERDVKIAVAKDDEEPRRPSLKPVGTSFTRSPKKELERQDTFEKPGKFVRPVLKKVAKVEEKPIVSTIDKTVVPTTVPLRKVTPVPVVVAAAAAEESSEEEETDSEEEETETETESDEDTASSSKKSPSPAKLSPLRPSSTPSKSPTPVPTMAAAPPPPPPPPGGPPPPPPPPPGSQVPADFEKKPISAKHKQMLEKLKSRPRRRPDWSDMMKEVESGRKLKHVTCNDRSSPILTSKSITNIKGVYVYETEKANVHNILLKQIQFGVRLKPTKCSDRSKPILEGLRKFRRQMTIEEQIQKSESRAQLNELQAPVEESDDEMDDIDKLRDDLQSTKQMLALELRNKEAQDRENKRLLARVQNLEAELERERWNPTGDVAPVSAAAAAAPPAEALVQSLKSEAQEAQRQSHLLEKKYQEAAEHLDSAKAEVEEQKRQIANLERRLAQQGGGGNTSANASRRQSEAAPNKDSSPEPEDELSESEDDEDDDKKAERLARRLNREVKMMATRLDRLKDKEQAAKKERESLRDAMKKNQAQLKVELKKFKKLQREVDKMAAMMKEDDEEGSDDEEKEQAEEEEDEEEESEEDEESETDESEEETDDESESENEDASDEAKKTNYEPRIKRHDGRVAALKKGNYMLQTNVDRLQDEINKMREKSVSLQADLDSVLSELG